jgi:hypothetical protein
MVISMGFNISYSYVYRKYILLIFFTFCIYTLPSTSTLPLTLPALHSCPSLFRCWFIVQWEFCLGIFLVNILCLSHSSSLSPPAAPLNILPHPFPSSLLFRGFQCVSLCLVSTQMPCVSLLITFYHSFQRNRF